MCLAIRALPTLFSRTQETYQIHKALGLTYTPGARTPGGLLPDLLISPVPPRQHRLWLTDDGFTLGTLALECRSRANMPKLQDKVDMWLGPENTVSMVLVLVVRIVDPVQGDHWYMCATLWAANEDRTKGPHILQGPIEFGTSDENRKPLPLPCTQTGTHILKLPMNLLYRDADEVPTIPDQPGSSAQTWNLDLFYLQNLLLAR